VVRGREIGLRRRFAMTDSGDQVLLETIESGGLLRRVRGEYRSPAGSADQILSPTLMIVADGRCRVQVARRLSYDADGKAEYLEQLSPGLDAVETREAVNPPVPAMLEGEESEARGAPQVAVAVVDAGVNYLLPVIAERLARRANGEILGFDYWDLDRRPFDANPVRSPFFPQRHGTQTASLLLHEAPRAQLVPYRYPRPDMMRMADLIEDAAADGVVILNMSLGSNRAEEWQAFEKAAGAHPEMLFVVSAGNNGRDIDSQPVYPAALGLENMLVVSSADASGRPARGSNWGRESVDLLVPAEEMLVTDFSGRPRLVSGSSYAAVRVSALAACLLEENPDWRAEILTAAILERAEAPAGESRAYSAYGFLRDPSARQRGACAAMPRQVVESARFLWTAADLAGEEGEAARSGSTHELRPTLVMLEGTGWQMGTIRAAMVKTAPILAQCGIVVPEITVRVVEGPERVKNFRNDWSTELVSELAPDRPAVFFVNDTLQEIPFDAEAIGRSNSRKRRQLADTVWMTAAAQDSGISLAHELYHVVADSGQHDPDPMNLMHERSNGTNTTLRASQCLRLIRVGEASGNLTRIN
jgi:subtilisin family serine protease